MDFLLGIKQWVDIFGLLGSKTITSSAKVVRKSQDARAKHSVASPSFQVNEPPEAAENYTYRPLQGDARIRMLILEPGIAPNFLRTSLIEADLDDDPQFEAVSYCWGDASDRHGISIDGRRLSITSSLHSLLVSLRKSNTKRILWADAICINQQDTQERTQQVQLMQRIYEQCQQCLYWLGPHTRDDGPALKLLANIAPLLSSEADLSSASGNPLLSKNVFSTSAMIPGQ